MRGGYAALAHLIKGDFEMSKNERLRGVCIPARDDICGWLAFGSLEFIDGNIIYFFLLRLLLL